MKKFFEASIVSRRNVEGKVILTVQAVSAEAECLGELTVKTYNEESKSGLFFKYVPSPEANNNDSIAAFKILTEDQKLLSFILETIKEGIQQKAAESGKLETVLTAAMICDCIDAEKGQITMPCIATIAGIHITNDIICKYAGDEWIGGEMKMLPEVQDAIKKLADKRSLTSMM